MISKNEISGKNQKNRKIEKSLAKVLTVQINFSRWNWLLLLLLGGCGGGTLRGRELTTVDLIAGLGAIDFAVAASFHGDAGPVLAREFTRATFAPVFHLFICVSYLLCTVLLLFPIIN